MAVESTTATRRSKARRQNGEKSQKKMKGRQTDGQTQNK